MKRRDPKYNGPYIIIGIDPSLTGTGVCYKDGIGVYCFDEISPKTKGCERLRCIRNKIRSIYETISTPIVFIEGYAFSMHSRSVTGLAELGGVIRMDLYDNNIPFVEIPPSVLKKFVTGKGNVAKDLILKEVYRRWNMDLDSHNLADAFGLVKLGEAKLFGGDQFTKAQMEVVSKVTI